MKELILKKLKPHLILREGVRNYVYKDTLGKLTGGVGHLILPKDNLNYRDPIDKDAIDKWLDIDAGRAVDAALIQAKEMDVSDVDFIVALASVNFQLGAGWTKKFSNTWGLLKRGRYFEAVDNIEKSLWAKQTPVRVRDFCAAIKMLALTKPKKKVQTTGKIVRMNFNKGKNNA